MARASDPAPTRRVRLHVDAPIGAGADVALGPDQAHYLLRVMRLSAGDPLYVFNGRDGEWRAEIVTASRRDCLVTAKEQTRAPDSGHGPWLACAAVKRAALDLIVRQATELGIAVLLPVITARAVPERINKDRLARIAAEAAEQSERITVPAILDALALERLAEAWPANRTLLVADETGSGLPLATLSADAAGPDGWGLLIGPEGGFAPGELDGLRKLPFVCPVGLGPRVLRAETAAAAGLALGQAVLGDLGTNRRAG